MRDVARDSINKPIDPADAADHVHARLGAAL